MVEKSLQTRSHISKADFIKWRELALSYTLPQSWASAFKADRLTFTVSGRNLFVWTKYEGTGDPEVNFNSSAAFTRLDYSSLPQVRRLSASVRATF